MTDKETGRDWGALATRGELAIEFHTAALAARHHQNIHPAAALLGYITPDHGPAFTCSFDTPASAALFVREMRPRTVEVYGVDGEDVDALRAEIAPADVPVVH